MSTEKERLDKIAQSIEERINNKDKEKILKIAQVVDEFADLILQSYLIEMAMRRK